MYDRLVNQENKEGVQMAKIYVGDQEFIVTSQALYKLAMLIHTMGGNMYDNAPDTIKTAADLYSRTKLYSMEKQFILGGMDKEEAKKLRPEKKASPAKKLLFDVMLANALQGMEYAELRLAAGNGQITDFTWELKNPGENGG